MYACRRNRNVECARHDRDPGRGLSRDPGCVRGHWTLADEIPVQGLGAPETLELVQHVLAAFEADLRHGSLVTIKARKTTCHRLPIGSSD